MPNDLTQHDLWYKDAIIYETHVRAFFDSTNDGVGDFCGLTEKLDYLRDLGVTAIWLLPFYPSPLKDDGYDIADYNAIHPAYGTLDDFKTFLHEAHARGLRVITELVLNHTSDQHPWFQRARRAPPGSAERNFYVWSDTPERYQDARIIFQDFESSNWTWDPVANAYYWHRFYSHQPDLNFDSPQVRKAILDVVDFWLGLGVDGLRLDAVPYLFEQEGTTGENLPKTHVALRRLRRHIDEHYANRMLLAEANQWPEDAVAYFGGGDECHMAFHFPLMPRLFMSLRMEDRFPIIDIMDQTPEIPETAQWALFLRNHDELTLEMVTDEERLYMYRTYAYNPEARINLGIRRRLAPLLNNNRRKIELLNGLLLSMPGTPVIYYGDEIGMGDNVYLGDRDGVRTPMQWNSDRNAGFSKANPQQLYLPLITDPEYHYETVHVEAQQRNTSSLLWWMKRLIALRKRYLAFGRGSIEFLNPRNRKVLAFFRHHEQEHILVVANLSRFVQHVELDLAGFSGQTPIELFGRTRFPQVAQPPYALTLGPHGFYWFALEHQPVTAYTVTDDTALLPTVTVEKRWEELIHGDNKTAWENLLPGYLRAQPWFLGKQRTILVARVTESILVDAPAAPIYLLLVELEFADSEPETVLLPVAYASGEQAQRLIDEQPHAVIARLQIANAAQQHTHVLYDAIWGDALPNALMWNIAERRMLQGSTGTARVADMSELKHLPHRNATPVTTLQGDHNNAVVVYGEQCVLKLFRLVGEGINPEFELGRFLNQHQFANTPTMLGALEYHNSHGAPMTLAVVQSYVPNRGEGWVIMRAALQRFLERARSATADDTASLDTNGFDAKALMRLMGQAPPQPLHDRMDDTLALARLLGQRTAEMHRALEGAAPDPSFAPEPFTSLYQRSLYQSMRSLAGRVVFALHHDLARVDPALRADAEHFLEQHQALLGRFKAITGQKIDAQRIRCHGNYHLEQVLFTGNDFVIFDFEGEPHRPLIERQLKHSPLRDVAHMLWSLDNAAQVELAAATQQTDSSTGALLKCCAGALSRWTSAAFLEGYCMAVGQWAVLPEQTEQIALLLDVFLLEKAIYELGYALEQDPASIALPLVKALVLLG